MKESELEARLVRGVARLGGCAYKFVSPGRTGVPDRLVVLPGGTILFAELKAEGGCLSSRQQYELDRLRRLGADVWEVWGEQGVRGFLAACREAVWERGSGDGV